MKRMRKLASVLLAVLLLATLSIPAALADTVYRETTSTVTLRSGAGSSFDKVTTVPKGDVVVVTNSMYAEWWKVKYTNSNGATYEGFLPSAVLKETKKRKNEKKNTAPLGCYKTKAALKLRTGPGTSYKSRTSVPKDSLVDVTDTTDKYWFKVTYINKKGKKYKGGYLSAASLVKAAAPYNAKAKTALRKSPSSSSASKCMLPKGAYVFATPSTKSKWYKVFYTDYYNKYFEGYVLKSKLKKGTITNKPYKQVDPEAEQKYMAKVWRSKKRWTLTGKAKLTKTASKKGKKVASLSKGAVVAVDSKKGKFWKVVWNDSKNNKKWGYLPKSSLKEFVDPNAGEYVTTAQTELRLDDKQTGEVLVKLSAYTLIQVKDTTEKNWYWATCKDSKGKKHTGFVYKKHAKKYEETKAGNYYTKVGTTLRETASETGKVLKDVPKGVLVKVKKTYNPNWYYLVYTNASGTVYKGFVPSAHLSTYQSLDQDYVAVVDTVIRTQPGSTAQVLADISAGEAVKVNDRPTESWYWASYVGADGVKHTGYIRASDFKTKEEYEAQKQQNNENVNTQSSEEADEAEKSVAEDESEAPAEPAEDEESADEVQTAEASSAEEESVEAASAQEEEETEVEAAAEEEETAPAQSAEELPAPEEEAA